MCGIGALSRATPSSIPDAALSMRLLALGLLERGQDATGFAWTTTRDPWPHFWKDDEEASLAAWDAPLPVGIQTALVHTRFATQGSPTNNRNNHPISLPGIVLVHNGIVDNDYEIFDMLNAERVGEVDSEAIAALLAYGMDVYGEEDPAQLLELIEGDAALAWINTSHPEVLHLARLRSRPLVLAWTRKGDLYAASTSSAIRIASCGMDFVAFEDVPEGTYLQVRGGEIIHRADVELPKRRYSWQNNTPTGNKSYTVTGTGSVKVTTTVKPTTTTPRIGDALDKAITTTTSAVVKKDDAVLSLDAQRKVREGKARALLPVGPVRSFVGTHAGTVDALDDPFDREWGE